MSPRLKTILNSFLTPNLVFERGEFDRARTLRNWSVQQGRLFKSWIIRTAQPNVCDRNCTTNYIHCTVVILVSRNG